MSLEQIEQAVAKDEQREMRGRSYRQLGCIDFPHVHADHALHVALERMGAAGLDLLPVVSRADIHVPLGIIGIEDVLASYSLPQIMRPKS